MKAIFCCAMVLWLGFLCHLASAQSDPNTFPLAGDWEGSMVSHGTLHHIALHMNTTSEGKMTALLDNIDQKISGIPAIGGSFDGSRLTLRFFYWKPNNKGGLEYNVVPAFFQ